MSYSTAFMANINDNTTIRKCRNVSDNEVLTISRPYDGSSVIWNLPPSRPYDGSTVMRKKLFFLNHNELVSAK